MQCVVEILGVEYFDSRPQTNIFDLQWSCWKLILLIARVSRLSFFLRKVFMKQFVNQLSLRDNELVEAKLSRDDELNKCHYRVYHVWCLDPVNTKDFFEIIRTIRLHSGTAAWLPIPLLIFICSHKKTYIYSPLHLYVCMYVPFSFVHKSAWTSFWTKQIQWYLEPKRLITVIRQQVINLLTKPILTPKSIAIL